MHHNNGKNRSKKGERSNKKKGFTGSSKMSSSGECTSARDKLVRLFCPPLKKGNEMVHVIFCGEFSKKFFQCYSYVLRL